MIYFANESDALAFTAALRWPDGKPACPKCGVIDAHYFLAARRVWKCKACRKQFSVKVGTVFEDSPVPLSKWLPALWMLANCKNGISSYEVARALKVTQKTAWFMLHRLRLAMQPEGGGKLSGTVEVDNTGIGGSYRFMHKAKRERLGKVRGLMSKTNVLGMLERGEQGKASRVRLMVSKFGITTDEAKALLRQHIVEGANVVTDSAVEFRALADTYAHNVVDHKAHEWVRGSVTTNRIENFWTLLKRTIKGTYTNVAPFHLWRYLDEQGRRFNDRTMNDGQRFRTVLPLVMGKRLTYAALTAANLDRRTA